MSEIVFHFDGHRLDPARRELWRGEVEIPLTPQVFDCLTYLLVHRNRAVGRDELIAAVWGRADITDTLLGQTVMHARRAVGDSGTAQQAIRTIPRFGYRWVGEAEELIDTALRVSGRVVPTTVTAAETRVEVPSPVSEQIEAVEAVPTPASTDRRRRPAYWPWAVLALVLVLLTVWKWPVREDTLDVDVPAVAALPVDSTLVLVLPVDVIRMSETAWIPLGIMDAIASRLRDKSWPVVPSATAVALTAGDETVSDAELTALTGAGLIVQPVVRHETQGWVVALTLRGRADLPATIEGTAVELLDAAHLASDRLLALLNQQPLPEMALSDPDLGVMQIIQQVEAEFLAGRLEAATALLASVPIGLRDRVELRLKSAELDYRSGRIEQAAQAYSALLAVLTPEATPLFRARALIGLGSIKRTRAQFIEAESYYREALEMLANGSQPGLAGTASAYLGISLGSQGRYDDAVEALSRARVHLQGVGDAFGLTIVESGFATLEADRRRVADAAPRLERAIAGFERLNAVAEAQGLSIALVQMYHELLDADAALRVSSNVWKAVQGKPSQRLYLMAAAMHAQSLIDVGRLTEATAVLDSVDVGNGSHDQAFQLRQVNLIRAYLNYARGEFHQARQTLAAILPDDDSGVGLAPMAWLTWLRTLRAEGEAALADAQLEELGHWLPQNGDEAAAYHALMQAEQAWSRGRRDQAWPDYQRALGLAERVGVPVLVVTVACAYGEALIAERRLDQAAAVVGRVSRWADQHFESVLLEAAFYRASGQDASWRRALERARQLAGERTLPDYLSAPRMELAD